MALDVRNWLEGLGLGKYAETSVVNDVNFAVLRDLDENDLERLGVSLGHRKKLLRAIADLKADPAAQSRPAQKIGEAGPGAASVAERRQLTVMFADLVGSTELGHRLDLDRLAPT